MAKLQYFQSTIFSGHSVTEKIVIINYGIINGTYRGLLYSIFSLSARATR